MIEVLKAAQEETQAATILITHDLGLVAGFCDRVAVMYAGRIVEMGDIYTIFANPGTVHGRFDAEPAPARGRERLVAPGSRASRRACSTCRPVRAFHPRCFLAQRARCHRCPGPAEDRRGDAPST